MNGKLKQGKWYWNTSERLLYKVEEVVEVDGDDWLAVHLEDGSRRTWNARALAAVSSLTDPPWWRRPLTPLIADELRSRGVEYLYHFTALTNLQNIRDDGAICSKASLESMGRSLGDVPGGNRVSRSIDRELGNWHFVSLSFSRYTPQFFVKRDQRPLVLFCLSPEIAGASGAIITDTNATSSDHGRFGDFGEARPHLNFDSFTRSVEWSDPGYIGWKRSVQAEVLVPDRVPLCFVSGIIVEWEPRRRDVTAVFGDRFPITVRALRH